VILINALLGRRTCIYILVGTKVYIYKGSFGIGRPEGAVCFRDAGDKLKPLKRKRWSLEASLSPAFDGRMSVSMSPSRAMRYATDGARSGYALLLGSKAPGEPWTRTVGPTSGKFELVSLVQILFQAAIPRGTYIGRLCEVRQSTRTFHIGTGAAVCSYV
jgi:hypothetical protein